MALLSFAVSSLCSADGYFCQGRHSGGRFRSGNFNPNGHHHRLVGVCCLHGKMVQPLGVIAQDMSFPWSVRLGYRRIVGVLLPCTQDRRCIQGRAGRQTQSRTGGGIRIHISGRTSVISGMVWYCNGRWWSSATGVQAISRREVIS